MTTARFKVDLERGRAGEQFLLERHLGVTWPPEGERRWDLERPGVIAMAELDRAERIEVKTDSYDPAQTPNFFMELLTVVGGWEVVGGPWRARADGVDTFVYLYHKEGRGPSRAFWFYDLPALVKELDTKPSRFQMRSVKLDRLKATGLLVPRAALAHLYTEEVYK